MKTITVRFTVGLFSTILFSAFAQPSNELANCNVVWNSPSEDSRGSMPLGHGDIGLNVWVEKSGDLVFYISNHGVWNDLPGTIELTSAILPVDSVVAPVFYRLQNPQPGVSVWLDARVI